MSFSTESVGALKGWVLGHEISGVVDEIGAEVPATSSIKVGDKVMVYPWRGCQKCETCLGGATNACDDNPFDTEHIGVGLNPGGYSSHVPVPKWDLAVKIPENIPMDMAAMLPCSCLTTWVALGKAVAAIERGIALRQKANLLVIGAGGLGAWCVNLAKMRFQKDPVRVISADISDERLVNARKMGADDTVVWKPDATVADNVSATTALGKIDAAIDLVGATETAQTGLGCLYKGSTLIIIGFFAGKLDTPIPVVVSKSLNIQGSHTGKLAEFQQMVEFLSTQKVKCPPVEYYKLDDVNTALDKLQNGKIKGRALLQFDN